MKKILKKIIPIMIALILCLQMNVYEPKAASVSVSIALSASTISLGNSVTATVSVNGSDLSAYTMYVTYNSGVLQYTSGGGAAQVNGGGGTLVISGTSSGSVSLTFKAIANGSSGISTSGTEAYNINLEQLSISHAGVNVTVKTDTEKPDDPTTESTETTEDDGDDDKSSNCNLASLQISPGTLEPAFSPDVTSYFVQVDEDVTSMVVSATTEDSKAKTEVYGAGLIEPGENSVRITVTAENGSVKVYKLRVVAGEDKGEAIASINGKDYHFVSNENNIDNPEGFTKTTAKYKDWEVLAYEAPNKLFKIVCLIDDEDKTSWYMLDEKNGELTFYQEYSSTYIRYVILKFPEDVKLPDDFKQAKLNVNEQDIEAYQSERLNDKQLYVVYAMNIEDKAGLYLYDEKDKTFMRYVLGNEIDIETENIIEEDTEEIATPTQIIPPTDKQTDNDGKFKIIVAIISAIACILLIALILLFVKNRKLKQELNEADDMLASVSYGKVDSAKGIDSETKADADSEQEKNSVTNADADSDKQTKVTTNNADLTQQEQIKSDINSKSVIDEGEIFLRESERINTLIRESYDAGKDSAFSDKE